MHLGIEPTAYCNLKCPFCDNKDYKRKKGNMTKQTYKNALKQKEWTHITYGFGGEPLLHPEIDWMIQEANRKGIKTILTTNGTKLKEHTTKLAQAGLNEIIIDLETNNERIHKQLRPGSNLKQVKQGIQQLANTRNAPKITISQIKTNLNPKESLEHKAKELGAKTLVIKELYTEWGQSKELKNKERPKEWKPCNWLDQQYAILWNGDLTICCGDIKGEYKLGNINEETIDQIIERTKAKQIIKRRDYKICKTCNGGINTLEYKRLRWI